MKRIYNSQFFSTKPQSGQALITLVFFIVIGIAVVSASTLVLLTNTASTSTIDQGTSAYYAAESAAENALLYLLRNQSCASSTCTLPSFAAGAAQASATITSGTITATGTYANAVKKIQINTSFANGIFTVTSWKEVI